MTALSTSARALAAVPGPDSTMSEAVERLTVKIRTKLHEERGFDTRAANARLSAGQALLDLKTEIDADPSVSGGLTFWEHFERHIACFTSRREAERRMALARSEDPEGDHEEHRRKAREGMARTRDRQRQQDAVPTNVSRNTGGSTDGADTTPIPDDRDDGAATVGGSATTSLLVEQMKRNALRMSREERGAFMTWWMEQFDA